MIIIRKPFKEMGDPWYISFTALLQRLTDLRLNLSIYQEHLSCDDDTHGYRLDDDYYAGFWKNSFHSMMIFGSWQDYWENYSEVSWHTGHRTMNGHLALDAQRLLYTFRYKSNFFVAQSIGYSVDRYGVLRISSVPCQKTRLSLLPTELFKDEKYPDECIVLIKMNDGYRVKTSNSDFLATIAYPATISMEAIDMVMRLCTTGSHTRPYTEYDDVDEFIPTTIGIYDFFAQNETIMVTICSRGDFVTWPGSYTSSVTYFTIDTYRYMYTLRYLRDAMRAGTETITITETRFGVLKVNNQICYYDRVPLEAFDSDPLKAIPIPHEWYYKKPAPVYPPGPYIVGITKAIE